MKNKKKPLNEKKLLNENIWMMCAIALTFIFVLLKICKVINWSWIWVFSPIWIMAVGLVLSVIVVAIIVLILMLKEQL